MLFKSLLLYRLLDPGAIPDDFAEKLAKRPFMPPGPQDAMSAGWITPARHAPDQYAYPHDGAFLVALKVQEKLLPADVVSDTTDERVQEIEAEERRAIGKKERKEIQERVFNELLPRAFVRNRVVHAVIDPRRGWIWVNTPTPAKAEQLVQFLRETLGSLPTKLPQTQLDPVTAMSTWLEHGAPQSYTIDSDGVLKAPGEGGAKVTLRHHDMNADEVRHHLNSGKLVTELALSWNERLAFVLTEKLAIKRLSLLDLLDEQLKASDADDAAAMLDGTLALLVGQVRYLIDSIVDALGGEIADQAPATNDTEAVAL